MRDFKSEFEKTQGDKWMKPWSDKMTIDYQECYIKWLEDKLNVASVSNQTNIEFFGNNIEFLKWYSGMSEEKIIKAYQRWIKETKII